MASALDELIEKCSNLDTPDLFSVIVNGLDLMRAHLAELDLEDCGVGRTMMAVRAGVTEALLRFAPGEFTAAVVWDVFLAKHPELKLDPGEEAADA